MRYRSVVAKWPRLSAGVLPLFVVGLFSTSVAADAGSGAISVQPKPGDPLPGLNEEQLERFFLGKEAFSKTFLPEEGLGPVFNQNSCSSCHNAPVIGGQGSVTVTRFGAEDKFTGEFDPLEHLGGSLLQSLAIYIPDYFPELPEDFCAEVIPDFADVIANRVTNSALGLGLVEAIPNEALAANEGSPGTPADGVVHWVFALEDLAQGLKDPPVHVGRMGWKSQLATVLSFSADASLMEMGITSWILPDPVAPNDDHSLMEICDSIGPPHPQDQPDEEGFHFIDRLTDFQRWAAPPPQTPRSGMRGEELFNQIGCADCHISTWMTADDPKIEPFLRAQVFKPYSDFLLHDMGIASDGIWQGSATGREIRTPSLWGVRDRDPLWHDARIAGGDLTDRITGTEPGNEGVIFWHGVSGSSAAYAAAAFEELSATDQQLVVAFLDSLGRLEFDVNGDYFIDDVDLLAMIDCFSGSSSYVPRDWPKDLGPMDHECAIFDINQDGLVDETDFAVFVSVYEGGMSECELWLALADGVGEGIEVTVPDECLAKPCLGDLNGSGSVDVFDLLVLLGAWGACADCPEDLNSDGVVDVFDLLILLGNWGPCN